MINEIKKNTQERMEKVIKVLKNQLIKIHTGRASPSLLDNIIVERYGIKTPLRQLVNIIVEDSRTLAITVFDRTLLPSVEKSIRASNLGLNPFSTGSIVRVPLPPLTEERRNDLIKVIRSDGEQNRISIRYIRRDVNDKIRSLLKNKKINEDDEHFIQDRIQNLTDIFIKKVDEIIEQKEKEIMEF
ncbi:MAG: ribosome recycling factor [Arsenophonus sp.]